MADNKVAIRKNADLQRNVPASDWLPNLQGRPEVTPIELLTFRRIKEDLRDLHAQIENSRKVIKNTQQAIAIVATPIPPVSVFGELTIGSPGTSDGGIRFRVGTGSPEGVIEGSAFKDIWLRSDATVGAFLYLKESGQGKTGWIAKF